MILNLYGLNGSSHNTTYSLLVDMYSQEYAISICLLRIFLW